MEDERRLLEKYGGHLVLAALALLILLGSKTRAADGLLSLDQPEPSPVAAVSEAAPQPFAVAESAPAEVEGEAAFDIGELPVLADHSLSPAPIPVTYKPGQPQHEFITYTVQPGDTAIGIAESFGIREETILGGNSFLQNDAGQLWAGTEIIILPIDGVLHDVVQGDTIDGLAEQYEVPVEDIIAYEPNNLEFPYRLTPGTQILVPGAVAEVWEWEAPNLAASSGSDGTFVAVPGTGVFVRPWSGGRITQNPWYGHMAVDAGLVTGSPIYASDTGTVTFAGWAAAGGFVCYGNLIVINHGNGFETYYAHLNDVNVVPGQTVYQGGLIGWSGNTGCSSGPHIHFEIRYLKQRQNPWNYIP
ncbi:MAG TPA: peptidoglycan DD-metalloendopeptidase family protein [Candidatus Sulfomarinibacteraceae bacterium]|nr:peptidoglycan DD-metalloendopeptidase family protein [Candidatus Sulfomarinibacteraceae bacterium]